MEGFNGVKNALFEPFLNLKSIFYQDRLGTNIAEIQKKYDLSQRWRSRTCATSTSRDATAIIEGDMVLLKHSAATVH